MSTQDLKALFRKIALNPDAQVDWSEVSCTNNCNVISQIRWLTWLNNEVTGRINVIILHGERSKQLHDPHREPTNLCNWGKEA